MQGLMKKFSAVSLIVSLFAFYGPSFVLAAPVGINGSFETGIAEVAPGFNELIAGDSTSITGWTVASGGVDYIGSYWQSEDSSRNVDLNGLTTGSLSQTFATVIGATYDVSFWLSGNPDNQIGTSLTSPSNKVVRVSATGATYSDFSFDVVTKSNTRANMMWENHTYSFVATGVSTTLTFASQIAGAFGPAIDNVVITETLPPVEVTCPANTTRSTDAIETVTVPAGLSTNTLSSNTLSIGSSYILKAYGTANAGDGIEFDARYSFRTPTSSTWTDAVSTYESYGVQLLDLYFNGSTPWGSYNSLHEYKYLAVGNGSQAAFSVYDVYYTNNTGDLKVDIYSCVPNVVPPVICDEHDGNHEDDGEDNDCEEHDGDHHDGDKVEKHDGKSHDGKGDKEKDKKDKGKKDKKEGNHRGGSQNS